MQFTEITTAFDQWGVITVAAAPGGSGMQLMSVGGPTINAFQQWSAFSAVRCGARTECSPANALMRCRWPW